MNISIRQGVYQKTKLTTDQIMFAGHCVGKYIVNKEKSNKTYTGIEFTCDVDKPNTQYSAIVDFIKVDKNET